MTQLTVACFNNETKAIAAYNKLHDLELFGIIAIYDKIIVRKQVNGRFEIVREETEERWKILKGMLPGGLSGSIGGPAGFIAGVFAGTTITTLAEISHYNFSADFISKVEQRMAADTVAVITETGELSDAFINDYIKPFDAIVIKANINLPSNNNYSKVIAENQHDIEEAVMALKNGADRNAARTAIGELKEKRKSIVTAFDAFDIARFHSMTGKSVVAD